MLRILILFCCFLSLFSVQGQTLKLEDIMKGYDFIGHPPSNPRWGVDEKTLYFEWNPLNEKGNSTYFWNANLQKPEKLPENRLYEASAFDVNQQGNETMYFIWNGILFSHTKKTNRYQKIIHTSSPLSNLVKLNNPNTFSFQMNGNLFVWNAISSSLEQVSNFKSGDQKPEKSDTNFLEKQQRELFTYIQDHQSNKEWQKAKNEKAKVPFPKEVYIGKSSLENLQLSPDRKFITFRLSDYADSKQTNVEHFITENGYTKQVQAREKVSIHALSSHRLGVINLENENVTFIDFSSLTNFSALPNYLSESQKSSYPKTRKIVMNELFWNESGKKAVMDVRSLDNKDRWIVAIDFTTLQLQEIDYQHDDAWIGGPGIGEWDYYSGVLGFIPQQEKVYFQSEKTGFSHLYVYDFNSKKTEALTAGKWEVREVFLNKKGSHFYITSTETHPGNRSFYKISLADKKKEAIFTEKGAFEVVLTPDEQACAYLFSTSNKPMELFYASFKNPTKKIQLTHSTTKNFEAYPWVEANVIQFEARDGNAVYARIYEPNSATKNGAAVIFVHGAGYLQNAHNYWSTYHREYMFHHLLRDLGYTVLDIDYRASDGYGRDVRTLIYQNMGGFDLTDQLDGKKMLVEKYGIDKDRVGIYGGSYGGFITLMAMMKTPGEFACGAALRSVTDWAHYNLPYTSNILNFPETDPEAYQRSSPIYYAKDLKGPLLMLHGMVDDNVQFQDIVRLTQRFIELDKQDWDLAVFPVEAHGFKESYSWLNEYRRILDLMNKHLLVK
jgi:dipeptidyl aminopeptidase/acylaminoacyl peptidase